jgi:hypothetical protein
MAHQLQSHHFLAVKMRECTQLLLLPLRLI